MWLALYLTLALMGLAWFASDTDTANMNRIAKGKKRTRKSKGPNDLFNVE